MVGGAHLRGPGVPWIWRGIPPVVLAEELQAFAAGGQNIFVYRGFLEATDNPDQVIGVVAHETGHIAGGHLLRSDEGMEDASTTMILATSALAWLTTADATLPMARMMAGMMTVGITIVEISVRRSRIVSTSSLQ